jgi:hypothetical protein
MSLENDPTVTAESTADAVEEEAAAAAADKMRQAAELRRQRILDNANQRMGVVEGRVAVAVPDSNDVVGATTAEAQPSTVSESVATTATTAADTTAATTTTSSTSAKLAAMRKRRFRTAGTAATGTAAAASSDSTSQVAATATAAATTTSAIPETIPSVHDTTVTLAPVMDHEMPATAAAAAANVAARSSNTTSSTKGATEVDAQEPVVETKSSSSSSSSSSTTASAKYLGVAKMRRKMLQEHKSATTTTVDVSPPLESSKPVKKPTLYHSTVVPIYMHIATVLLLFAAGLDVGLQQRTVNYVFDDTAAAAISGAEPQRFLAVHSELAPRQMGGTQRLLSFILPHMTDNQNNLDDDPKKPSIAQPFDWASQSSLEGTDEPADEFDVATNDDAAAAGTITNLENVDPLFQVDLDQYTQGTGPFWSVARSAVRLHRLNLAIFYYAPRSLFRALIDFLWSLWQSPPVLCITAIALRQLVGKLLLGAQLPTTKADEAQQKDVLTMVKNFVSNVVLKSFPTAVTLYDVWTHLRADMYVLLCGFLVGLAWSHNGRAGSMYGTVGQLDTDSLAAIGISDDPVPAGPILDSLGDEL